MTDREKELVRELIDLMEDYKEYWARHRVEEIIKELGLND